MKTLILKAYIHDEEGDNEFFVFQFDREKVEKLKRRTSVFKTIPSDVPEPAYVVWLGESWGEWVSDREVGRLIGKTFPGSSEDDMDGFMDVVQDFEVPALPGEQDEFCPVSKLGVDEEEIFVSHLTSDNPEEFEICFSCLYGNTKMGTISIPISRLEKILDGEDEGKWES